MTIYLVYVTAAMTKSDTPMRSQLAGLVNPDHISAGNSDRVSFRPAGRGEVIGMLIRYNKKTVTLITDSGEKWNVAPGLLSPSAGARSRGSEAGSARHAGPASKLIRQAGTCS